MTRRPAMPASSAPLCRKPLNPPPLTSYFSHSEKPRVRGFSLRCGRREAPVFYHAAAPLGARFRGAGDSGHARLVHPAGDDCPSQRPRHVADARRPPPARPYAEKRGARTRGRVKPFRLFLGVSWQKNAVVDFFLRKPLDSINRGASFWAEEYKSMLFSEQQQKQGREGKRRRMWQRCFCETPLYISTILMRVPIFSSLLQKSS